MATTKNARKNARKNTAAKTANRRSVEPREVAFSKKAIVAASRRLGGGFEVTKDKTGYKVFFINNREDGKREERRVTDDPQNVAGFLRSRSRVSPFTSLIVKDPAIKKALADKDNRPFMAK